MLYEFAATTTKKSAAAEILIMLIVSFILGWLLRRFTHKCEEKRVPATSAPAAARSMVKKHDDLTVIEGVGPAIAEILNDHDITSFDDLASASAGSIKSALEKAGPRFRIHDPSSWAEQARLAADEKWDELDRLQDSLTAGK